MKLRTLIALAALSIFTLPVAADPAAARESRGQNAAAAATDLSSQTQRRRSRTRVYVYPERPPAAWPHPRPGDVSWPGPGAVRDCVFRLEPEYRPSGTVIVPRQSCWWVRG